MPPFVFTAMQFCNPDASYCFAQLTDSQMAVLMVERRQAGKSKLTAVAFLTLCGALCTLPLLPDRVITTHLALRPAK